MLFVQTVLSFFMRMKLIKENYGISLPSMLGWTKILAMFKVKYYRVISKHSFSRYIYAKFSLVFFLFEQE